MSKPLIIAIDGPAASGKGTLARRLAAYLGFAHLDTGGLYRAVGLMLMEEGTAPSDAEAAIRAARNLDLRLLEDPRLRGPSAGEAASQVAAVPEVRAALLHFQRQFAARSGANGAILDGRDIGTVICPDATVKLYVTASPEARARRRFLELRQRGEISSEEEVLAEIKARDRRDETREAAPLRPAADAYLLDTTNLDIDGAFNLALKVISGRIAADNAQNPEVSSGRD